MYCRVPVTVPGFCNWQALFLIFFFFPLIKVWKCHSMYLCKGTKFLSDFIQAQLFKKTNPGSNWFSYVTSKLRNCISSPTSFVNFRKFKRSNFVDNTLCSREWIFLSHCDNVASVFSQVVHSKADDLLGYCSKKLLNPEDKNRLINTIQHLDSSSSVEAVLSSPYFYSLSWRNCQEFPMKLPNWTIQTP